MVDVMKTNGGDMIFMIDKQYVRLVPNHLQSS
jgi:hypothetical protein